jgi:hypothetical protein
MQRVSFKLNISTGRWPSLCRKAITLMKRSLISSGSTFEAEIGYSRAVVQGDWIFVSGTTGFDYSTMTISDDLAEQTEQSLKNIALRWPKRAPAWPMWSGSLMSCRMAASSRTAGRCCANTSAPCGLRP